MANLTKTAYLTRKIIKYTAFLIVFIFIFKVVWGISTSVFRKINPPEPPPPTVEFGNLPNLSFPRKETPEIEYKLETIEGTLPQLAKIGTVYFLPKKEARLFALENTKALARKIGFTREPQKISPTKLLFTTGKSPNTTLEIDMVTHNFKLDYDFLADQEILAERKLPNETQAVSEAKSFLSQLGLLTSDLAQGEAKVSYLKLQVPNLISAISFSEADFIRVDLFRKKVNGLPVLPPNPKESSVFFIFSGSRSLAKRIIKAEYKHAPVVENLSATYPLKSTNVAWQELISGGGYIANLGDNKEGKVIIRRIYLAYYEANEPQDFLQPIFVFEGDGEFFAYVPAIEQKWVE